MAPLTPERLRRASFPATPWNTMRLVTPDTKKHYTGLPSMPDITYTPGCYFPRYTILHLTSHFSLLQYSLLITSSTHSLSLTPPTSCNFLPQYLTHSVIFLLSCSLPLYYLLSPSSSLPQYNRVLHRPHLHAFSARVLRVGDNQSDRWGVGRRLT